MGRLTGPGRNPEAYGDGVGDLTDAWRELELDVDEEPAADTAGTDAASEAEATQPPAEETPTSN